MAEDATRPRDHVTLTCPIGGPRLLAGLPAKSRSGWPRLAGSPRWQRNDEIASSAALGEIGAASASDAAASGRRPCTVALIRPAATDSRSSKWPRGRPAEVYLRLMVFEFRDKLGDESLCR